MRRILGTFILAVILSGCLDFGDDEETNAPTKAQVDQCRSLMYLEPSLAITPLGFKRLGSGMDDAIWFKFETPEKDLSKIFVSETVDTSKFRSDFSFSTSPGDAEWWDVKGKTFLGEQVSLPNVKFMNVGIETTDSGHLIYVMWHEI